MARKSNRKVNVYYSILKPKNQDANIRAYYINNYIGQPFISFDIGDQDYLLEKITVATHLGLEVEQINIVKRGKKGA